MAYTKNTSLVDNGSDSQLLGRDVLGMIKDRVPNDCALTKLIKNASVDNKTGKVTYTNGVIESKISKQSRVEHYTHAPKTIVQTAGASSALLDAVLANAATQINTKMVFQNSRNNTQGYVDKISGTTITFVSMGDTFSVLPGDELVFMGSMYEYGSSDPTYTMNTDDFHYNVMGIYRHPIETTLSAKDSEQNAGGNLFDRYSGYNYTDAVRNVERNFIFGQRPASGNTTSMSELGTSVPHSRGLWDMAQATYSFGGNMTFSKIMKNLPLAMDRSVDVNKQLMWLMGNESRATLLEQMQNNTLTKRSPEGNKFKKWGITADVFITSGVELAIVKHDAFNWGSNVSRGIIFDPSTLVYRFKNGSPPKGKSGKGAIGGNNRNWNIIRNIESNSSDTQKDDLFVECCLQTTQGGYDITTTTQLI